MQQYSYPILTFIVIFWSIKNNIIINFVFNFVYFAIFAIKCIINLAKIGFSVYITIRFDNTKFKIFQTIFAIIAIVFVYFLLIYFAIIAIYSFNTKVFITIFDYNSVCCRIITVCNLYLYLNSLTSYQFI